VQRMQGLLPPGGYQHIVLALDAPAKLARWKLAPDADVTVVLYNKYRTVAVHSLAWDQLKPGEGGALPPKVKEVLGEVREKFGATRCPRARRSHRPGVRAREVPLARAPGRSVAAQLLCLLRNAPGRLRPPAASGGRERKGFRHARQEESAAS